VTEANRAGRKALSLFLSEFHDDDVAFSGHRK
jgi:hypothetical protein